MCHFIGTLLAPPHHSLPATFQFPGPLLQSSRWKAGALTPCPAWLMAHVSSPTAKWQVNRGEESSGGFILCPWDHSSYVQREDSSHSELWWSPIVRCRHATAGCPGATVGKKCNKEYEWGLPHTHSEHENSLVLLLGLNKKGSSWSSFYLYLVCIPGLLATFESSQVVPEEK